MQPSLEDYRVNLDCYSGPLDLLLYLVRRHEIDIHNLPIAQLTEQYLEHLKLIREIDVNLAGEFLVMAATLLEIKSQMLLPPPEETEGDAPAEDGASPTDPRWELIQQLLAYKRYKDAAMDLEERQRTWEMRYPARAFKKKADESEQVEIDLEDANVLDLCEAFARILDTIGKTPRQHEVTYDDTPIALHAEDIVDRLGREGKLSLGAIFVGRANRAEMIGLFLATLELVRQKRVRVVQEPDGGEITLEIRPEADQAVTTDDDPRDWRNPETGEIEYDWPDERSRRRAERRARMRAKRAAQAAAGQPVPPEEPEDDDLDDDLDEPEDEAPRNDESDSANP